jgi:AAA15 family ATPase/GTPase
MHLVFIVKTTFGIKYLFRDTYIMIKSFGARNYYSFKEGLEVDFSLTDKVPSELRERSNLSYVMGIKGANGSGKTNILKALKFILDFTIDRWALGTDKRIPFKTFFNSTESSEFYLDIVKGSTEYNYSFELSNNEIIYEKLETRDTVTNKSSLLFTRVNNKLEGTSVDLMEFNSIVLKSNSSLVSMYTKYSFSTPMPELREFHSAASLCFGNITDLGYYNVDQNSDDVCSAYNQSPEAFELLKKVIKKADHNIEDVSIIELKKPDGETAFFPTFSHKTENGSHSLSLQEESSGTQAIFKRMYIYWWTLRMGGTLIYDEFDIHLHALLLPVIVDLFTDKETNPYDAQLIFTAHNTEILEKLGRYRTIIVDKKNNESYCYRLDELKGQALRNGRPISQLYLRGKLGGVPKGV